MVQPWRLAPQLEPQPAAADAAVRLRLPLARFSTAEATAEFARAQILSVLAS